MLLVDAVEERVGAPVETWPTSILKILLAFDPQMPFSEMSSQNLSLSYLAITYLFPRHVFSSPPAASFHRTSSHRDSPTHTTIGPSFRLTRQESRIMICKRKMWKYTDGTTYESAFPPPTVGLETTGFPTIPRHILLQTNQLEWVEDD